jgi:hypothetical protein
MNVHVNHCWNHVRYKWTLSAYKSYTRKTLCFHYTRFLKKNMYLSNYCIEKYTPKTFLFILFHSIRYNNQIRPDLSYFYTKSTYDIFQFCFRYINDLRYLTDLIIKLILVVCIVLFNSQYNNQDYKLFFYQ